MGATGAAAYAGSGGLPVRPAKPRLPVVPKQADIFQMIKDALKLKGGGQGKSKP